MVRLLSPHIVCCVCTIFFFFFSFFVFLMMRRPPRSTLDRSSAASDVYKRQDPRLLRGWLLSGPAPMTAGRGYFVTGTDTGVGKTVVTATPVSYTHLRAHETVLDLVCRLLLEKKTKQHNKKKKKKQRKKKINNQSDIQATQLHISTTHQLTKTKKLESSK